MAHVHPASEQLSALSALGTDTPVTMLNLLRFREQADYAETPDLAPEVPVSGATAYATYGRLVVPHLQAVDGTVMVAGAAGPTVIGPQEEDWDHMLLVRYPSVGAFFTMVMSEGYQAIVGHRTAAVADSRLVPVLTDAGGPGVPPGPLRA